MNLECSLSTYQVESPLLSLCSPVLVSRLPATFISEPEPWTPTALYKSFCNPCSKKYLFWRPQPLTGTVAPLPLLMAAAESFLNSQCSDWESFSAEFYKYVYILFKYPESLLKCQIAIVFSNPVKYICVSCSVVSDSATPWTVAHQAPLSMEFSRQEYCSGLTFPSPGDLPDRGIKPKSPAL